MLWTQSQFLKSRSHSWCAIFTSRQIPTLTIWIHSWNSNPILWNADPILQDVECNLWNPNPPLGIQIPVSTFKPGSWNIFRIQFLKSRSILEIQINSKNPNARIKIQIQFSGGLAPHLNWVLEIPSQFHSNNPTADLVLQSSATENNMNLLKPGLKASNRDPSPNPILEIPINSWNPDQF